jgi:hypothetical protein
MALAPFTDGGPRDFTRGKGVSLLVVLALLGLVFSVTRRAFGDAAGWLAAAALALSPSIASLGQNVSADGLFTVFYVAAIWTLIELRDRLWGWGVFGFLCGLAWLTKGNGHFLLLAGVALLCRPHRRSAPLPPKGEGEDIPPPLGEVDPKGRVGARQVFVSIGGFVLGGWFLLLRNILVWGNPFHNVNNQQFWLDNFREFIMLSPFPEWNEVGPASYWRRHGIFEAIGRFLSGAGSCFVKLVKALAVGPSSFWQLTGLLMLLLAVLGLYRAWTRGRRAEILAVGTPGLFLLAAFSWGTPVFGANLRYIVPIGVSLLPFAACEAAAWAHGRERRLKAALSAACIVLLVSHRSGLARDPRSLWSAPDAWRETSVFIHERVDAGGYLADPASLYSEWDAGPVRRTLFPFDAPQERIDALLRGQSIHYVVRDAAVSPAAFPGGKLVYTSSDLRFFVYKMEN